MSHLVKCSNVSRRSFAEWETPICDHKPRWEHYLACEVLRYRRSFRTRLSFSVASLESVRLLKNQNIPPVFTYEQPEKLKRITNRDCNSGGANLGLSLCLHYLFYRCLLLSLCIIRCNRYIIVCIYQSVHLPHAQLIRYKLSLVWQLSAVMVVAVKVAFLLCCYSENLPTSHGRL